jgi:GT2 family glycosyltransferase
MERRHCWGPWGHGDLGIRTDDDPHVSRADSRWKLPDGLQRAGIGMTIAELDRIAPTPSLHGRPVVSVIIVSWNVIDHLRRCLGAICRSSLSDIEIIVVDNCSTDATRASIPHEFPAIRFVALQNNIGFPAANNIALGLASGEFTLLLNPDTEVEADCIAKCVEAFGRDPNIGMVGCRLMYPSGDVQLECACNMPSIVDTLSETFYLHVLLPHSSVFGRLRMSYWDHLSDRYVPRICGAFMMIKTVVLRDLGGLDERFFMYYEDLDLCARVGKQLTILYLSSAVALHHAGRSRAQSTRELDELAPVIRYTFYRDHRGRVRAAILRACLVFQNVVRLGIALGAVALVPRSASVRGTKVAQPRIHWARLLWCLGIGGRVDGYHPGGTLVDGIS